MPKKIRCTLPNVADEVQMPSGAMAKFSDHPDGGRVATVSDEDFEALRANAGYEEVPDAATGSGSLDAELAQLRQRGVELKIPRAELMGAKRLIDEIAAAEKAASGAAS